MAGFFRILIAVVLAYAWTWTSLLKDWGWVTEELRFKILVGVGILFILQQLAQNAATLADRSAVDGRKKVIEIYLRSLLLEYYALLESKHAQTLPPVRVNLALPTRLLFRWRLKITIGGYLMLGAHIRLVNLRPDLKRARALVE